MTSQWVLTDMPAISTLRKKNSRLYNVTVAEHQALYAKLQDLNVLSESLDQKTVDLLQSLETVHAELLALPPAPTSSEPIPPVPYEELLDYAKKISKFTPTAQLARGEEDFSGQKKDILAAEEINFLRQQRGSKVWPFPDEGKMKGGALGWLATGGEYKRENEKK